MSMICQNTRGRPKHYLIYRIRYDGGRGRRPTDSHRSRQRNESAENLQVSRELDATRALHCILIESTFAEGRRILDGYGRPALQFSLAFSRIFPLVAPN